MSSTSVHAQAPDRESTGHCDAREGLAEVEWALETSRSGTTSLQIAGHRIHSAYDPEREAEATCSRAAEEMQRLNTRCVVLLGPGLGLVPRALERLPGVVLFVYDPFPGATSAQRAARGLLGPDSRADSFTYDAIDALAEGLDASMTRFPPCVIIHPGYAELVRFEQRWLLRWLRHRLGAPDAVAGISSATVSPRSLEALARFPALATLDELADSCAEQTAIIASPGPGLDAALPVLAERTGGVLFAAVQALERLEAAGVRVDFAVAPDPLHSLPFVANHTASFDRLLAEATVEPALLDLCPGRTATFCLRSGQLSDLAFTRRGIDPIDEPFNTVSETALHLAHRLGARCFALVGVDLCGTEKGQFAARTLSGARALTNPAYFHAARYLDHRILELHREGCRFWRVGDGLPIRAAAPLDTAGLADLLESAAHFRAPVFDAAPCPERLRVSRELLRAAADIAPPVREHGAATNVDPENRWSPFSPLPPQERAAACLRGLAALDAWESAR